MAEINKKRVKMKKKKFFCQLLKAGRHAKAGRLPEICLFLVNFFKLYLSISAMKSLKTVSYGQKRLKTTEKKCLNHLSIFHLKFKNKIKYSI